MTKRPPISEKCKLLHVSARGQIELGTPGVSFQAVFLFNPSLPSSTALADEPDWWDSDPSRRLDLAKVRRAVELLANMAADRHASETEPESDEYDAVHYVTPQGVFTLSKTSKKRGDA